MGATASADETKNFTVPERKESIRRSTDQNLL